MKNKMIWLKADEGNWDERKAVVTTGMESGVDAILVDAEDVEKVKELGNIKVAAFALGQANKADIMVVGKKGEGDGTKPLPSDYSGSLDVTNALRFKEMGLKVAAYVIIRNKEYENFAAEMGSICDYLIVIGTDWQVIPLENLIAGLQTENVKIISGVKACEEARLAFETMEHGTDGVLLDTKDLSQIKRTSEIVESAGVSNLQMQVATVTKVEQVGMGDRVCVDTCNLMNRGEGMLVGSQANGMFLVHSESDESHYVASRPFRVNAGAVHAYIKVGEKTRYLSELKAGDEVTIIDGDGKQRSGVVGRVKIERRPLILVEADLNGKIIKNILQNAETIKLVTKDKEPVSVTDLMLGDEILVHSEEIGRHFGMKIEETIIEK